MTLGEEGDVTTGLLTYGFFVDGRFEDTTGDGEVLVAGSERSVGHPKRRDDGRVIGQYRTLAARVDAALSARASRRPRTRPST